MAGGACKMPPRLPKRRKPWFKVSRSRREPAPVALALGAFCPGLSARTRTAKTHRYGGCILIAHARVVCALRWDDYTGLLYRLSSASSSYLYRTPLLISPNPRRRRRSPR